jgi:hypothetical protein
MKVPVLSLGMLALLACRAGRPVVAWHEEEGYRWRELASPGRRGPGFTRMDSTITGIRFRNTVSDSAALRNRHLMQGSGVAIGDVNGDGRPDIYLCRIEGPNALYLNEGNWRFREAAADAGVALPDRASTGAVFADVNGDGALDLLVMALGGGNTLFLNDGRGHFTDATAASGLGAEARGSTTATLADVDGDGALDLYIANYKTRTMLDSLPPGERTFDRLTRRAGSGYEVRPQYRDNYRLVDRPELGRISLVQRADPDWFYRGDGKGHFAREPIAHNPRFLAENGRPLEREPDEFGLAARFYDVNGDGAPDLYVANDFEDPDRFWINDGRGSFRLIAPTALRRIANSNMAVDFADIDRDGNVDLFQADMLANDRRRKTELPTHTTFAKPVGDYGHTAQWQRNALLLNRGDGTFAEIADFAGVAASGWSWSAMFLDVDLDGFEDLLIGNGHTWDLMDGDAQERARASISGLDWKAERSQYPPLALPNVAFRNRGDRTFEDVSARWRWGTEDDLSHGMAAGDLDGDGDLDVVVNRLDAPAAILRNDARAPRIAVRLAGAPPNTRGIGARVRVQRGAVPEQSREVTAGGLYLSGADQELSFATGSAAAVDLEVRWRSGGATRIRDAAPGRVYEVKEVGGAQSANAGSMGNPGTARPPEVQTLFEDISPTLNHTHAETGFNDYLRQPLLPRSLSQLGPGVSWCDLDGDGKADLLVPDGAGGALAWYRNEGARFTRIPLGFPAGSLDFTMALCVPGAGGGRSLLVGRSSYRAATLEEAIRLPGVARLDLSPDGTKVLHAEAIAGPDSASVGALALADLSGTGRLDLFVAGRVIPGAWPLAASSHLFRETGGRYEEDPRDAALFHGIGPVSAALFTDVNGDARPDLVLAIDGGPIRVFLNEGGRLVEATDRVGLSGLRGHWNGIASGDFDGDGRLDLVATNWGRNLPYHASAADPLLLYVGRFGPGSTVDVIPAARDSGLGAIAPIESFARLSRALPNLRRQVPSYRAYASATMEQLLGPLASRAQRIEINSQDHLVLLNRGGRFEPHPLPDEAQFAPAFGVVVNDFDGDGREDLFLAQNFSQTELGTPRFDAGRGLLLLGDGKGGFTPMPGQYSGIAVYGDQRGAAAADLDGDGRVDLAVGQNAAPTRLFHNRGATPGLQVRLRGAGRNPDGIGAQVRVRYPDGDGPVREIQAGSGYWSSDGTTVVLGIRGAPRSLLIRWAGGGWQEVSISGPGTVEARETEKQP